MTDSLQRFIFDNADIRGAFVSLNDSCDAMFQHQSYDQKQRELLAEFASAAVLLMGHLKFEGTLTLQVRGGEGVELVMAECNHNLEYRATLKAEPDLADLSFKRSMQNGIFALTLSPAQGSPYQGMVPLDAENLAQSLSAYFMQSEQLPTWFYFIADGKRAAAMMLQAMPAQVCLDADEAEEHWERIKHLASTLKAEEMLNLSSQEILYRLFHEEQVRIFNEDAVRFSCTCSQERMERGLLTLGADELRALVNEQEDITTQCHFCGAEYRFGRSEMLRLLQSVGAGFEH